MDMSKRLADFNRYFTSSNSAAPNARISVPTSEWRALHQAIADSLASAGGVEIDRLRDALEHIQKACVLSRTQSRRIRWIETRAHGALIGDDRLHRSIDLPKDGGPDTAEKLRRRMLQDRHTFRVAQGLAAGILSAALSKEREVADGLAEALRAHVAAHPIPSTACITQRAAYEAARQALAAHEAKSGRVG